MSCGPGDASGWPWKQNAGLSVRARPCSVPSNSETCVGAQVRRQRLLVDREAVVLAGDADAAGVEVLHRVVGAVVAELHLEGLRAGGERHDLVAEADAEGRHAALRSARGSPRSRSRTARDRRARWTGRCRRACSFSTSAAGVCAGTTVTLQPRLGQHAQDVALDAEVVGDDVEASALRLRAVAAAERPLGLGPLVGLASR